MITTEAQSSSTQKSATDVVQAFLSALEQLDVEAVLALAAPDIRWENGGLTTSKDKAGFEKVLRMMADQLTRFEVQFRDIHERGDGVVFTDRTDIAEGGGFFMNLPVRGEFRVRDGLITEWNDQFNWLSFGADVVKSAPGIAGHWLRKLVGKA